MFLSEGVQKFLFPAARGAGRFRDIGFFAPEVLAYSVACVEVCAGVLVLLGLFTRLAALSLVVIMSVAIVTTKVPILLGHGYWIFGVRNLPRYGFWPMAHASRTDFAMLAGSLFLLIAGAGP